LSGFQAEGLREKVKRRRRVKEKSSLFVLYFPFGVPDLSSASSAGPTEPHTKTSWIILTPLNALISVFLCLRMVSLPCILPVRKTESK